MVSNIYVRRATSVGRKSRVPFGIAGFWDIFTLKLVAKGSENYSCLFQFQQQSMLLDGSALAFRNIENPGVISNKMRIKEAFFLITTARDKNPF